MREPDGQRLMVPTTGAAESWRARVLVTTSDQRLRLPRDLIGAAIGMVVALISWISVAAGADAPVTVEIPTWISHAEVMGRWMLDGTGRDLIEPTDSIEVQPHPDCDVRGFL